MCVECDEQKPCSRCTRLGLADTCQVAELQKRGRKRKTESQITKSAKKSKAVDMPIGSTPATAALQNFENMPFDLNMLLNNTGDVEPFVIDEFFDMSKSDHSGKVFTDNSPKTGFSVYDDNYIDFLLSSDMYQTPISPSSSNGSTGNTSPHYMSPQQQQQQTQFIPQQQQQVYGFSATGPSNIGLVPVQQYQSVPLYQSPVIFNPVIPQQQQQQQPQITSISTAVSPQTVQPVDSEAEALREKIKQLQFENTVLKSSLNSANHAPVVLSEQQRVAQQRFVNQSLRFNAEDDQIGIIVSARNGNVISMNPFMREKLGYSHEDVQFNVTNWQQLFDTAFWPKACAWAERNINDLEENAVLANCVFRKKGSHDPPFPDELVKPKAFATKFCYDCTSRSLLFSITQVYF
jgi:PAS domain-containing protein